MRQTTETKMGQPEKQAAIITSKPTPFQTGGVNAQTKPFLVIVLDEADSTGCGVVVRAKHCDEAEEKAVAQRKADNDLSDLDDEAAGFKSIAVYSHDYLLEIVRQMRLPEPDV